MPTVINNPSSDSSGVGVIVGVLVAIVLIVLFFVYGLPGLRGAGAPDNGGVNVNVDLPGGGSGSGTYTPPAE